MKKALPTALLLLILSCCNSHASEQTCISTYSQHAGTLQFLKEYYNIFGRSESFSVNKDNLYLASCLLKEINKKSILLESGQDYRKEWFDMDHKYLSSLNQDIISTEEKNDSLSPEQKAFIAWSFSSNNNYSTNLDYKSPTGTIHVVGWECFRTVTPSTTTTLATFGLLQCAAVLVASKSGDMLFTYTGGSINQEFRDSIISFLSKHPDSRIFIIGSDPAWVSKALLVDMKVNVPILLSNKNRPFDTVFAVKVVKNKSDLFIYVSENALEMDTENMSKYVKSIEMGYYPRGRVADIFPVNPYHSIEFINHKDLYTTGREFVPSEFHGYFNN